MISIKSPHFALSNMKHLENMLSYEISECGIANPSEDYFSATYKENFDEGLSVLNKLFVKHYGKQEKENINLMIGILHILSHFEFELVSSMNNLMVPKALKHENEEICEYAIKCYENWENFDFFSLQLLKQVKHRPNVSKWLCEYSKSVLANAIKLYPNYRGKE